MRTRSFLSLLYEDQPYGRVFFDGLRDLDFDKVYVTISKETLDTKSDKYGELDAVTDLEKAFEDHGHPKPKTIGVKGKNPVEIVEMIQDLKPSLVINLCEFLNGRNIKKVSVCSILDLLQIPYTGNDAFALGLATDKFTAKAVLEGVDIATPEAVDFAPGDKIVLPSTMSFPLIVKPVDEDSSVGIDAQAVVKNDEELQKRVQYVFDKIKDRALVESFVEGREVNVAVLGNLDPATMPICEVGFENLPKDAPKINTYNAKFKTGSEENKAITHTCPAKDLSSELQDELRKNAIHAFQIFRCRDYARCDYRISKDNRPYMIEVNANPDIANIANFGIARKSVGMDMWVFIEFVMGEALRRKAFASNRYLDF